MGKRSEGFGLWKVREWKRKAGQGQGMFERARHMRGRPRRSRFRGIQQEEKEKSQNPLAETMSLKGSAARRLGESLEDPAQLKKRNRRPWWRAFSRVESSFKDRLQYHYTVFLKRGQVFWWGKSVDKYLFQRWAIFWLRLERKKMVGDCALSQGRDNVILEGS